MAVNPHARLLLVLLAWALAGCGRLSFDAHAGDGGGAGDGVPSGDATDAVGDGAPIFGGVTRYEAAQSMAVTTVTIAPVDPATTMVLCYHRSSSSSVAHQASCALTDATTVTLTAGLADTTTITSIQVIPLPAGSTVQRGSYTMGSGNTVENVPITAVDLATSFVVFNRWVNVDTVGLDDQFAIAASLPDASTLRLQRTTSGNTVHVDWQVVTSSVVGRVIPGMTTLGVGVTVGNATVPSIDPNRTIVIASSTSGNGDEAEYMVGATMQTPTMVKLERTGAAVNSLVSYFVIELIGGTAGGGVQFMTNQGSVTRTAGIADPARAIVFLSTYGGRVGQNSDYDDVAVTPTVVGSDVRLDRADSPVVDVGGVVEYTVLQW